MVYLVIITMFFAFVIFCNLHRNKNGRPTKWPLVGMLPALLKNIHRIQDYSIETLELGSHLTNKFKGPRFANMDMLLTVDPANFHHILSKNFGNYVKGSKFNEIVDVLGDGILNTDSTVWQYHRKVGQSFFHHPKFHPTLIQTTWNKVESGLIPVLDHASEHAIEIDLQDFFLRFMYDTMCVIMLDYDPKSLSVDFPNFPLLKAVADMERVIIARHTTPTCIWKLLRWLNLGGERKYKEAWKIADDFIYKCIDAKKEQRSRNESSNEKKYQDNEVCFDLLTLFMDKGEQSEVPIRNNNEKFLRDTILNFFAAGGESTSVALSWFFYLLTKNPRVIHKIKEELSVIMMHTEDSIENFLGNFKELSIKLVYLHAALCEALRLYSPIVFNQKTPLELDTLPSGHRVNKKMQIILNIYAMGRMKSIWGDDCNEFKPERWITEGGMIKHVPSHKFSVFGAGPRACLGKQMAFTQMKVVAAIIIQNYYIQAVEKSRFPDISMVAHMKHGFKVKVFRSK